MANLKSRMEYRISFLLWFGNTLAFHAVSLGIIWALLSRFPSLNGWNFREMVFLYALGLLARGIYTTFFFPILRIPHQVRTGNFDRYLIRPLNPLFQILLQGSFTSLNDMIVGVVVFTQAVRMVEIAWSVPLAAFMVAVVIGGGLIQAAVSLLVASASFWVIKVSGLTWTVQQVQNELIRYPASIYGRSVQLVLTIALPVAFTNYYPATTIMGKADGSLLPAQQLGLLTPLVGIVWFALAYAWWKKGVSRYQGTGS
jgi:ABC-2 type transport system permease protein